MFRFFPKLCAWFASKTKSNEPLFVVRRKSNELRRAFNASMFQCQLQLPQADSFPNYREQQFVKLMHLIISAFFFLYKGSRRSLCRDYRKHTTSMKTLMLLVEINKTRERLENMMLL